MTSAPVPLAEQPTADEKLLSVIRDRVDKFQEGSAAYGYIRVLLRLVDEARAEIAFEQMHSAEAIRQRDATLQQHERAMAVVEAARRVTDGPEDFEAANAALIGAVAALDAAANTAGDAG